MEVIGYTKDGSIAAIIDGESAIVPDDMRNRHRLMIAEWEAEGNTIPPYVPDPEPEPITIVYPADLWRRVTNDEADVIAEAMQEQPLRLRKIFETAQVYRSDDELWPLLQGMAVQLFGETRASEILAPSNG